MDFAVHLSSPVPAGGMALTMSCSQPNVLPLPKTVILEPGTTRYGLKVATTSVSSLATVNVTLSLGGTSLIQPVLVTPVTPMALYAGQATVVGGKAVSGNVVVLTAKPAAGTAVTIQSSNPAILTVPSSVIATGEDSRLSFTFTTAKVTTSTAVVVSVSSGGVTKQVTITVTP